MVLDDAGSGLSRAPTMSEQDPAKANDPATAATAGSVAHTDESAASTITVNTKTPSNFPPPKTDKPRPHLCTTCQRCFARLEHLKRHERSHTKEKPFECPECTRCFARRDLLLRHQQKLHQTSTPSSRPRNRRESASGLAPGQSRARKNSMAGTHPAAMNPASNLMRPRANTISHIDGAAMHMLASANSSASRSIFSHSRHPSLAGLPMHSLDHVFGDMPALLGTRRAQHDLPRIATAQFGSSSDFDNGLRTAPLIAPYHRNFDLEGPMIGAPGASTINPNALHYNDSPQSMALDQAPPPPPFGPAAVHEMTSGPQPFDEGLDWVTGFEHQMSFAASENVIEESSPSAISTASQSGMSDVMLDGSNHPAATAESTVWQPSVMGPPQMPNPFTVDLNNSVFPDLLNGAPLSPQPPPPSQSVVSDSYFSTPPPSLSPSIVSGMKNHNLSQPAAFTVGPETPLSLSGGGALAASTPVATITDATRLAIVNTLSQCLPFGGRRYSFSSHSSPVLPQHLPTGGATKPPSSSSSQSPNVPATQDLQRFVEAYLTYFHPHLPFLHVPTLSFDLSSPLNNRSNGVNGIGCMVLSMAAIGALYEADHARSREIFDSAKKMILLYLGEERRKSDARKGDTLRSTPAPERGSQTKEHTAHTPVWLVQAMLLNVLYGYHCADKTANDIASTHCAALVSLAQAADLLRPARSDRYAKRDAHMSDDPAWNWGLDQQEEHQEWLQWKSAEERKRTLYAVFIMSSLLVAAYNQTPILTNSEIHLDLPCDEEFFSAESSAAFSARGGAQAADRNRLSFYDALGDLLRTNERTQKHGALQGSNSSSGAMDAPLTELAPSSFGCLVLINALHNYIWETRQRHDCKLWTNEETEKMHRHIEPALKAWQTAWQSNPQHHVERPNPYGLGPISADAISLLDLAYVRLFVNLSKSKEKFWQRDWDGVVGELGRGSEILQPAEPSRSSPSSPAPPPGEPPAQKAPPDGDDPPVGTSPQPTDAPDALGIKSGDSAVSESSKPKQDVPRQERHLRRAAFFAADSLAMSDKIGVTFADFASRELPFQSALCAFDCAQVLAEWILTLQERIGSPWAKLGRDLVGVRGRGAEIALEEEDVKLLEKVREILASAELKLDLASAVTDGIGAASRIDDKAGHATRILRLTATTLDKAAVWPITHLMARCLESHAEHAQARTDRLMAAP